MPRRSTVYQEPESEHIGVGLKELNRRQWWQAYTVRDAAIVLLLVSAAVASWIPRARGPIDLRWDAAVYYILGTSIAQQHAYRLSSEPGEIAEITYPPLMPAMVAAHEWLFGTSDPVVVGHWLRLTFCLVLGAYFVVAYILLRTRLSIGFSALGAAVCALQWYPHWLSDRCYSDLPFAVAVAAFFIANRSDRRGAEVASGMSAVAAYLLRSAGIALLVAWVADRLLVRDWKRGAARLVVALVPVVAWQGYLASVQHGVEYQRPAYPYQRADYNIYNVSYEQLASLRDHWHPDLGKASRGERATRFLQIAAMLPAGMAEAVSVRQASWTSMMEAIKRTRVVRRLVPWAAMPALLGVLAVLIAIGLARQLIEGERAIPIALLVYGMTLCIMPTSYMKELPRYMVVLAPVLALALMKGVVLVHSRLPTRIGTLGVALLFGLVIALQAVTLADLYSHDTRELEYSDSMGHRIPYRLFTYDRGFVGTDHAIDWLNAHGRRDSIVAASVPHWVYLRTGLRAVMPPMEHDAVTVRRLLDAVPIRYVIVESPTSFTGEYVAPVLRQAPAEWRRVLSDPENQFEMYERRLD